MYSDKFLYTRVMQQRKTTRLEKMLEESIAHFPELYGKSIAVGYTKGYGEAETSRFLIRLNPRKLSYYVIGHELTHLVQGMYDYSVGCVIPKGEIACDIWTIARSDIFLDEPPGYLNVGKRVLLNWNAYRNRVRSLCIDAIEKRKNQRNYIRWLTNEIRFLPQLSIKEASLSPKLKI